MTQNKTKSNEKITTTSYKGVPLLTDEEKKTVEAILDKYHEKIQRYFNKPIFIELHVKEYNTEGTAKKYSLHARLRGAAGIIEADHHDWNLSRTMHRTMEKLMNELESRFHVSDRAYKRRL